MAGNLGDFLRAKLGDRSAQDVRAELSARGIDVNPSTVYRWFRPPPTGRYPRLECWAHLCEILGLTADEIAAAQALLAHDAAA